MTKKADTSVQKQLQEFGRSLYAMRALLFIATLVAVYGFIVWRIQSLATAEPDAAAVATQTKATSKPHVDPKLVEKIENLESTNVSVKALFVQARQNPFHE